MYQSSKLQAPGAANVQVPLIIRCLAEKKGDQWQAFSLEFGLAAQADTEAAVKKKLQYMIFSYLYDALVGEDKDHFATLLTRRATASVYLKYYFVSLCQRVLPGDHHKGERHRTYDSPVPMTPHSFAA